MAQLKLRDKENSYEFSVSRSKRNEYKRDSRGEPRAGASVLPWGDIETKKKKAKQTIDNCLAGRAAKARILAQLKTARQRKSKGFPVSRLTTIKIARFESWRS